MIEYHRGLRVQRINLQIRVVRRICAIGAGVFW